MRTTSRNMDRLNFPKDSLYEVNGLCAAVRAMEQKEQQKLSAVIRYTQPRYAFQMRLLAENLDLFDFIPGILTAEDYGRFLIQESGHYEYDENLEPYYDYEKCGREQLKSEAGAFNELGYVSYHGTMSLDELMMEDPVEQYRKEQGMEMGGLSC